MDPYEVLGVPRDAELPQIKQNYRRLSRMHHPDKGGDIDKMAQVNLAYEILKDPDRRSRYNQTGETAEVPLENIARGRMIDMFLKSGQRNGWKKSNYISNMKRAVDRAKGDIDEKVSELQHATKLMDEMIPNSVDEEGNMFASAIRQQQDIITKELQKLEYENLIADMILRLLEPYEDNLPPQQFAQSFFFSNTGTTTSTGGF